MELALIRIITSHFKLHFLKLIKILVVKVLVDLQFLRLIKTLLLKAIMKRILPGITGNSNFLLKRNWK